MEYPRSDWLRVRKIALILAIWLLVIFDVVLYIQSHERTSDISPSWLGAEVVLCAMVLSLCLILIRRTNRWSRNAAALVILFLPSLLLYLPVVVGGPFTHTAWHRVGSLALDCLPFIRVVGALWIMGLIQQAFPTGYYYVLLHVRGNLHTTAMQLLDALEGEEFDFVSGIIARETGEVQYASQVSFLDALLVDSVQHSISGIVLARASGDKRATEMLHLLMQSLVGDDGVDRQAVTISFDQYDADRALIRQIIRRINENLAICQGLGDCSVFPSFEITSMERALGRQDMLIVGSTFPLLCAGRSALRKYQEETLPNGITVLVKNP
ncbi:MAG TPA: hypothetical protein VHV83_12410 [Armatimonadota bacterium]|nr:hypothetical protein [Armatimonadota bacterium]